MAANCTSGRLRATRSTGSAQRVAQRVVVLLDGRSARAIHGARRGGRAAVPRCAPARSARSPAERPGTARPPDGSAAPARRHAGRAPATACSAGGGAPFGAPPSRSAIGRSRAQLDGAARAGDAPRRPSRRRRRRPPARRAAPGGAPARRPSAGRRTSAGRTGRAPAGRPGGMPTTRSARKSRLARRPPAYTPARTRSSTPSCSGTAAAEIRAPTGSSRSISPAPLASSISARWPSRPKPVTSVPACTPTLTMAREAASLRVAASRIVGIISSSVMAPCLRALASTPMPRRLVSTSRSPGRAPPL